MKCRGLFALVLLATISVSNAQAGQVLLYARMSGPAEAPPNTSPGAGLAFVTLDDVARTMRIQADFWGLQGNTTVAHIHGPTASPFTGTAGVMTPVPTFPGFPGGVKSGSYDRTFDLSLASSYNPSFVTASGGLPQAEQRLVNAILSGRAYLNIHSTVFPGGEIRGFFAPVPEPATLASAAIGGLLLIGSIRARSRSRA
ncbi:MAG: CHRD domain-containing protein [Isosphaeraceae bacterium]|nr:CHRD domain-containing protein [Isosphaeraceae bacterium]